MVVDVVSEFLEVKFCWMLILCVFVLIIGVFFFCVVKLFGFVFGGIDMFSEDVILYVFSLKVEFVILVVFI